VSGQPDRRRLRLDEQRQLPAPLKLSLSGVEEVNRNLHNLFLAVFARLGVTSLSFKLAPVRRAGLSMFEGLSETVMGFARAACQVRSLG
jgi:hypothetical protein